MALIEKIKNVFKGRKKRSEFESSEKPQSKNRPTMGTDEISKSIRESEKDRLNKGLWRNVFH